MKCNRVLVGCALVWGLVGQNAVSAKPAESGKRLFPGAFPWRFQKAETYTFRDKGSGRMMRGVQIFISAPGYVPLITSATPSFQGPRAPWRLYDEKGRSYIQGPTRLRLLDEKKNATKGMHVLELTCGYVPFSPEQAKRLKLQFPFALRKITSSKKGPAPVFMGALMVSVTPRR